MFELKRLPKEKNIYIYIHTQTHTHPSWYSHTYLMITTNQKSIRDTHTKNITLKTVIK